MKIDLHVHSKYSTRPSQWFLQKIGCPESFTDPSAVYRIAKACGMSQVTITDHNRITGVLEIADLPGVFISEEVTSYFPEDRCKVHVLVFDITEKEHEEIQRVRDNLYDLVLFLNANNIFHAVAHPLYAVNDKLTADHFEKLLLLFKNLELNGSRSSTINKRLINIADVLTFSHINDLAQKHGIDPVGVEPWKKNLIGGSDDHSGLNITRTHSQVKGARTLTEFFEGINRGKALVVSEPATPVTLAHNLYSIAYQFYNKKLNLARYAGKDDLVTFLNRLLLPEVTDNPRRVSRLYAFINNKRSRKQNQISDSLEYLLKKETRKLIQTDPDLCMDNHGQPKNNIEREKQWFAFTNKVSHSILIHFADHLMDHLAGANVFNIFHTIGSAGGLYTLLAPYFIAYNHFTKDQPIAVEMERRLAQPMVSKKKGGQIKVAHFTDTFHEVNGVALTLRKQMEVAKKHNLDLTMITCHSGERPTKAGVKHFKAADTYALPEYPELTICYPPLLDMLHFCYESGFTQIHTATPGPVGLAALAIAKMLKLPLSGTYHTQIPQYVAELTGDEVLEELTWKYVLWYYDQMDNILVPSKSTQNELIDRGIDPSKIDTYPRGVDVEHFHPRRRNGIFKNNYGIASNSKKLLYVGRISKEKNLPLLANAFTMLCKKRNDAHLVIVGDGPYRNDMVANLEGLPVTFTGYLKGDQLADVYASADIFVFPSTTDTFGNVVMEAQASGIPVIVSDQGGPSENVINGHTGIVISVKKAESLSKAMESLIADPFKIESMGRAARSYMAKRSFNSSYLNSWEKYGQFELPAV